MIDEKRFRTEESGYDPLLGLTGFHRPVRSRSLGQGRVAHKFKKARENTLCKQSTVSRVFAFHFVTGKD